MDLIEKQPRKLRRPFQRDQSGAIIAPKSPEPRLAWLSVLRPLVLLYAVFTIFKAVFIYNADQINYTQTLSELRSGGVKEQVIATLMSPDYFTKPVGVLVASMAKTINKVQS
ncbi:MAG: hypothetical protein QM492_09850 [Rhodobacterales bacterium]